jgi:hypothetical protein
MSTPEHLTKSGHRRTMKLLSGSIAILHAFATFLTFVGKAFRELQVLPQKARGDRERVNPRFPLIEREKLIPSFDKPFELDSRAVL